MGVLAKPELPPGANPDWTIPQGLERYREAEHRTWSTLYEHQVTILPGRACDEFLLGLDALVLPVGAGVAIGIVLFLLHGIWSMTCARLITFEKVPGTSNWWPPGRDLSGETIEGVLVIAFQAPLSFLNAHRFQDGAPRGNAVRRST